MNKNKVLLLLISLTFISCGEGTTLYYEEANQSEEKSYDEKFINDQNCNQIIDNEFIVMCYDYKKKAVKAVSYTLFGDLVNEGNIDRRPSFYVEKELKSQYRISSSDYTNSGYDRGHMAPDAAFDWSEESLDAVYTLANIIPQAPQVNRRSWAKLEDYVRDKAEALGKVSVVNVVKYGERSRRMGKNRMAISRGYYKILYNQDEKYEECFFYSNKLGVSTDGDKVEMHRVSCATVSN